MLTVDCLFCLLCLILARRLDPPPTSSYRSVRRLFPYVFGCVAQSRCPLCGGSFEPPGLCCRVAIEDPRRCCALQQGQQWGTKGPCAVAAIADAAFICFCSATIAAFQPRSRDRSLETGLDPRNYIDLSPQTDQIGETRAELPFTSSVLMAACFPSQKEHCQPSLTRDAWHQLNVGSSILFEAPLCGLSCIGGQDGWQFKLQEIKQRFKCR